MKKHYSTNKEYKRFRRKSISYHLFKFLVRPFVKKDKIITEVELDKNEPAVYCANHALQHGPLQMFYNFPIKCRPWVTYLLCYVKGLPTHMMKDFFPNAKGIKRMFLWLFCMFTAPIIVSIMRSMQGIPVYLAPKTLVTYRKSVETLLEGKSIMIFPESNEPYKDAKYVNEIQTGFPYFALEYYRQSGKKVKFYPVYVCHPLHIIIVGKPIEYNPDYDGPNKTHMREIAYYIRDNIERIARSLPLHDKVDFIEEKKYK